MLKNDAKIMVTLDLLEQCTEINKALDRCSELALKEPLPNKQIVLITDASVRQLVMQFASRTINLKNIVQREKPS